MRVEDAVKNFREKDITQILGRYVGDKCPYILRVISTLEIAIKSGYTLVKDDANEDINKL